MVGRVGLVGPVGHVRLYGAVNIDRNLLAITHYSLLITHYSLLIAIAYCSLLIANCNGVVGAGFEPGELFFGVDAGVAGYFGDGIVEGDVAVDIGP